MSADELLDRTAREIVAECGALADLLVEKNRKYGDSALQPLRLFSRADAVEQLRVRIDDKLSRIRSAQADDAEDAELDLLGYLVLLRIARRKARQWGDIDYMLDPREAATPPRRTCSAGRRCPKFMVGTWSVPGAGSSVRLVANRNSR